MSLIIKKSDGGTLNVPKLEGGHVGTLVRLVDLGMQERGSFDGKKLADAPLLMLTFELPNELIDDDEDKPVHLHKEVLKSVSSKSTLFSIAHALLGGTTKAEQALEDDFDVALLLGKSAVLSVGQTSGGKNKITSVSPLVRGMTVPEHKAPLVLYSLDSSSKKDFEALPEFIRNKISGRKSTSSVKEVKKTVDTTDDSGVDF